MFTFAHLSDVHLAPLPPVRPAQLLNKRVLGYLSWHSKRKYLHLETIQQACEADLRTYASNHICITGDLTNLGLPQEFDKTARWLETLAPAGSISVIPGNHDAYIEQSKIIASKAYQRWTGPGLPYVHERGPFAFIGLSTAVSTAPFLASGRLGNQQLKWLGKTLHDLKKSNLVRVVMLHHPPQPNATVARKALDDAAQFREIILRNGAEMILHGHLHHPVRTSIPGPRGPVPVFGAGSASFIRAQYYIFGYENFNLGVRSRVYDEKTGFFVAGLSENLTVAPPNG